MTQEKGMPLAELAKERKARLIVLTEPETQSVDVQIGDKVYQVCRKAFEELTDWTFLEGLPPGKRTHATALALLSHVTGLTADEVATQVGGLGNAGVLLVRIANEMIAKVLEDVNSPFSRGRMN